MDLFKNGYVADMDTLFFQQYIKIRFGNAGIVLVPRSVRRMIASPNSVMYGGSEVTGASKFA